MAAADQKVGIHELQSQSDFLSILIESSICLRCGGLMVNEVFTDLLNSTRELECVPRRCVQCGDGVDSVILRNGYIPQESMTVQREESLRKNCPTEHR